MFLIFKIRHYFLIYFLTLAMLLVIIMVFNFTIDNQHMFHKENNSVYFKYARKVINSEYGVLSNIPVNDTIIRYTMISILKPDCVLFGSSHITTASAKEMPSIFGDCKVFLNAWVTGGGPLSGALMAREAVNNNVKVFVYEINPWWYNFANFEFWEFKRLEVLDALNWIGISENSFAGPFVTKFNKKQGEDKMKHSNWWMNYVRLYIDILFGEWFIRFQALTNYKYLYQNYLFFANNHYSLPVRGIHVSDDALVTNVKTPYETFKNDNILTPYGAVTYAESLVNRPSGVNRCDPDIHVPWAWQAIENTLKSLKEASVDTRIMLTPTHPMLFDGCKNYREQFRDFYAKLKVIADKYHVKIHGSYFPEDLGPPDEVAKYIKFDGHHINLKEGFKYMK